MPKIIWINFKMVSGKQLSRDLEEENERERSEDIKMDWLIKYKYRKSCAAGVLHQHLKIATHYSASGPISL